MIHDQSCTTFVLISLLFISLRNFWNVVESLWGSQGLLEYFTNQSLSGTQCPTVYFALLVYRSFTDKRTAVHCTRLPLLLRSGKSFQEWKVNNIVFIDYTKLCSLGSVFIFLDMFLGMFCLTSSTPSIPTGEQEFFEGESRSVVYAT